MLEGELKTVLEIEETTYINQNFTEVRMRISKDLWKKLQKSKEVKKIIKKYKKSHE